MDPNLQYWKSEGQTFLSRLKIWGNLLDPRSLLYRQADLLNAHSAVSNVNNFEKILDKDGLSWALSLSSIHADSGDVLPLVFRPPALFPFSATLVLGSLLPLSSVKLSVLHQFMMQSYMAGFNRVNRNSSTEMQAQKMPMNQALLITGTVCYTTCAGAFPSILIQRFAVRSLPLLFLLKSIVPVPLSAALAFFNVVSVRNEETENGIQVFDSNGNSVGISRVAADKAVMETAWSRAALLGATAGLPDLLVFFSRKMRMFQNNPLLAVRLRNAGTVLVFGIMVPLSFSLFPQLGIIKKERLEMELQEAAFDGKLYYHRGL